MADMRLLERTLAETVPLNRARNFLAKFVVALIRSALFYFYRVFAAILEG
jgi:hypothetical protein